MLTDAQIRAAIKDVTSETVLNDGGNGRGTGSLKLVIRRLSDGNTSATWFAHWKKNGQRTKKAIGRFPDLNAKQARAEFNAAYSGQSVTAFKRDERPTIEKMFDGYIESMRTKNRASADEVDRVLKKAAKAFGINRLAADISHADMIDFIGSYYDKGHRGAADKARAYLSAAFGWAVKSANDYTQRTRQDWGVKHNPVADIPKDTEASTLRNQTLTTDEIRDVWNAGKWSFEVHACVRLILATGQRVEECLRLHGDELDLDAAIWNMPALKTKGRTRPHTIPLPAVIIPVLRDLVVLHGYGPLFPGRTGSKETYIGHRAVNRALKKNAPEGIQARDLRRTWKSRAGELGISKEVRDLIQQHAKSDTGSRHYDRADYLPIMRKGMDVYNDWLQSVISKRKTDKNDSLVAA